MRRGAGAGRPRQMAHRQPYPAAEEPHRVRRWVARSVVVALALGAAGALTAVGGSAGFAGPGISGSAATSPVAATPRVTELSVDHVADGPAAVELTAAARTGGDAPRRYELPTLAPPPPETLTGYRWPLAKGQLTGDYGPARGASWVVDGTRFHDGIDIASYCGAPIVAAHAGTVLAAGRRYDRWIGWLGDVTPYEEWLTKKGGWFTLPITVVIDDGNGYRSIYTHLSRASVKRGARVRAGQLIGYEGASGNASGCHLHYGIFSPLETATFSFRSDLAKKRRLPAKEIARIDPFRVLGPLPPSIRLGWGVAARPVAPEAATRLKR